MPDGVAITAGSGTTIATDDAGASGHVQIVKLALSADGSASAVTADASGLLVNLGANNDVTVTSGSITADTELPAAAALADNTANPTVPGVGSFGHVWDGATWDRTPGTAADGVTVNLGSNNDVTVTGTVTANAGTNLSTAALALESGGNLAAAATSLGLLDNAISGNEMQVDIVAALPAGTNNIGDVDVLTVPRATTVVDVSLASAATSAQLLAANTARIGLTLTNTDANGVYVYFGTTATATKFTVLIPANGYYEMPQPIYTGRIDAIWASNGSGSLIGTELAA